MQSDSPLPGLPRVRADMASSGSIMITFTCIFVLKLWVPHQGGRQTLMNLNDDVAEGFSVMGNNNKKNIGENCGFLLFQILNLK